MYYRPFYWSYNWSKHTIRLVNKYSSLDRYY
nr:MAG TPA: hypothetical protein [Caudoviricetes sp.]